MRAAGAIVVVDGATRWWDAAALAVEAGAAAVLVAEPREVPLEPVAGLAELAARSGVPILVHRARLRDDLVALAIAQRAGAAPRVVVAECRAAQRDLPAMVRDAVGWTRALAGERARRRRRRRSDRAAGTALLRARAGGRVVGSLIVARDHRPRRRCSACRPWARRPPSSRSTRHSAASELATSTVDGRLVAPAAVRGRRTRGAAARRRGGGAGACLGRTSDDLLHDAEAAAAVARSAAASADL